MYTLTTYANETKMFSLDTDVLKVIFRTIRHCAENATYKELVSNLTGEVLYYENKDTTYVSDELKSLIKKEKWGC